MEGERTREGEGEGERASGTASETWTATGQVPERSQLEGPPLEQWEFTFSKDLEEEEDDTILVHEPSTQTPTPTQAGGGAGAGTGGQAEREQETSLPEAQVAEWPAHPESREHKPCTSTSASARDFLHPPNTSPTPP